ncbi:MAG: aldo/keto reductase [Kiritimatiellae bacterium]|nr:aldo/keto reductase [Kiritimatiellia bacterium]MDD5519245.1 aldo/keto reductase [Kiritimatiellia bacterium]
MKYTNTELTGKFISKIGLGCVTFGREIDKAASFTMMDYAYERGITFFDTASAYGAGSSETIVGEWIAARRSISDSIIVATKILPPYDPVNISKSVSQSLKRLGNETIDVLYLHRWDINLETPELFSSLKSLMVQGKGRMFGASNFTAGQLGKAVALQKENGFPAFRFVQNNNNFAVSDVNDDLINICHENDMSLVTYSPLGAGFLTGKHEHGVQPGTRFDIIPGHKDVYFNEIAYRRLARLQQVAARTGYSPVHLALVWALHQPAVSSVLIGGRLPAQIDQALVAMDFDVPDIFEQLEAD